MWESIKSFSPFEFIAGTIGGAVEKVLSMVGGVMQGAVSGAVVTTGLAAMGKLFEPTIKSALVSEEGPGMWAHIEPLLRSDEGMGSYLTNAAFNGAIGGGALGGLNAAVPGFVASTEAIVGQASGSTLTTAAHNSGDLVGSALALGAAAVLGIKAGENLIGKAEEVTSADRPIAVVNPHTSIGVVK